MYAALWDQQVLQFAQVSQEHGNLTYMPGKVSLSSPLVTSLFAVVSHDPVVSLFWWGAGSPGSPGSLFSHSGSKTIITTTSQQLGNVDILAMTPGGVSDYEYLYCVVYELALKQFSVGSIDPGASSITYQRIATLVQGQHTDFGSAGVIFNVYYPPSLLVHLSNNTSSSAPDLILNVVLADGDAVVDITSSPVPKAPEGLELIVTAFGGYSPVDHAFSLFVECADQGCGSYNFSCWLATMPTHPAPSDTLSLLGFSVCDPEDPNAQDGVTSSGQPDENLFFLHYLGGEENSAGPLSSLDMGSGQVGYRVEAESGSIVALGQKYHRPR